jgi:hypothetical protein
MDLFLGVPDLNTFSNQVHDLNPGVRPSGLFWTVDLSSHSVDVSPGSGVATLAVTDLEIEDYHNLPNALVDGPSDDADVSFVVHWKRGTKKVDTRDTTLGFAANLVENTATIQWTATILGQTFQSGPENTSVSSFAAVGHERNGHFFPQGQ